MMKNGLEKNSTKKLTRKTIYKQMACLFFLCRCYWLLYCWHGQDVNIHYVEAGDKRNQLMLCLHGFPEFWFSWRHQLKEFASTHWVVAVDLRGYGRSDKPSGSGSYHYDVLVEDVRQIIMSLGKNKKLRSGSNFAFQILVDS